MLEVGRIVRPHGLKGQVVVELWTDREERMAVGSELSAGDRSLSVSASSRLAGSGGRARWLVSFRGVTTRDGAEELRDRVLLAEPLHVEGVIWIHELIGAELCDTDRRPIGRVQAVEANPASDLLVLDDGRVIPLTFVVRDGSGALVVDGPPGLLDL